MKLLIGGKNRNIYMRKDGSAYYKSGGENVDVTHMFKKNGGGLKKQYIGGVQNNLGKVERTKRLKRKNKLFLGGTITFGAITVDSQKLRIYDESKLTKEKLDEACDEMIKLCQIYMNFLHELYNTKGNLAESQLHSMVSINRFPDKQVKQLDVLKVINAAFLFKFPPKLSISDIGDNIEYEPLHKLEDFGKDNFFSRLSFSYKFYPQNLMRYCSLIIVLYTKRNDPKDSSELNKNLIDLINFVYKSLFENAKIGMKTDEIQASNIGMKTDEIQASNIGMKTDEIQASNIGMKTDEIQASNIGMKTDEIQASNIGMKTDEIQASDKSSEEATPRSEGSFGSWIGQGDENSVYPRSDASVGSLGQSTASSAGSKVTVDKSQIRELVTKARDPNR